MGKCPYAVTFCLVKILNTSGNRETSLIENKIPDLKYYLSAAHEFYS